MTDSIFCHLDEGEICLFEEISPRTSSKWQRWCSFLSLPPYSQ